MEEAQNTLNEAHGFLDGVQNLWNSFTDLVGKIPGINGSLEDIVGGLLLAGLTGLIGLVVYGLING